MEQDSQKSFDVCGLGMSMVDLIHVVDEFPKTGGVTEAVDSQLMGGGPVPTALCTIGQLGGKAAVLDRIGDDWKAQLVVQEYQRYGVNAECLFLEPKHTTTLGSVLVRQHDGERHVVFSPGDFTPLSAEELPVSLLKDCQILHLNGRHWPACLDAADITKKAGGLVSFDGGAGRYETKFDQLLGKVDILIVARDFVEKFSDTQNLEDQIVALVNTGASVVAITDGAEGSWFASSDGEVFHQPAYRVKSVVDTTGCGDAFHGGYLYAHSHGWSLRESASFASAVAALNATGLGGRGHLPTLTEVRQLIVSG